MFKIHRQDQEFANEKKESLIWGQEDWALNTGHPLADTLSVSEPWCHDP